MNKLLRSKKFLFITVGVVLLIAAAITAFAINSNKQSDELTNNAPNFSALLPSGETIEDLGGWQTLSPPTGDVYYVYTDSVDQVSISVSQQALPETFKPNPGQSIEELAKAYSATENFQANGTKVYIGTSASGPQSVLFTKNELLVLIKSQQKIDTSAWTEYINSLR